MIKGLWAGDIVRDSLRNRKKQNKNIFMVLDAGANAAGGHAMSRVIKDHLPKLSCFTATHRDGGIQALKHAASLPGAYFLNAPIFSEDDIRYADTALDVLERHAEMGIEKGKRPLVFLNNEAGHEFLAWKIEEDDLAEVHVIDSKSFMKAIRVGTLSGLHQRLIDSAAQPHKVGEPPVNLWPSYL